MAVYGVLQQVPGILSVSFSVDNAEPTVYTPWDGTQTNSSVWSVASQMYHLSVSPGSHTLRVSLKQATGSQVRSCSDLIFSHFRPNMFIPRCCGWIRSSRRRLSVRHSRTQLVGRARGLAWVPLVPGGSLQLLPEQHLPTPSPAPEFQVVR